MEWDMKTSNLPLKIKIASPCPTRWQDMGGDDRVRFCDHCRKNVYNFSAMSATEARELLAAKSGELCARIYQRADGTVLTEDCPVGVARFWRQVKTVVGGCVVATLFVFGGAVAFGRDRTNREGPVVAFTHKAVWQVKEWLGLNPSVVMLGVVGPRPPVTNQPFMGKIAAPQPPPKK
jgi:hypothetical protein